MIKQDIVDNVANATGLTKVEVEAVLNESVQFVESLFRARDRERTKFIVYQQYSSHII